jgi:hypothetical protein
MDILAARVLHFAPNQIVWECREHTAMEADPENVNEPDFLAGYNLKSKMPVVTASNRHEIANLAIKWWLAIVSRYSQMHLSYSEYKLPALSGMSKEVALILQQSSSNHQARYLAGLWDFQLFKQLTWFCLRYDDKTQRPPKYRAPSRSWASIDGQIMYNPSLYDISYDGSDVASVIEINVDLATTDTTGQVSGGQLRLRGPLRSLTTDWFLDMLVSENRNQSKSEGFFISTYLDVEDLGTEESKDLHCMALQKDDTMVNALILQRTGIEGQFRRVGLLTTCPSFGDNCPEDWESMDQSLLQPTTGQCPQYKCYDDETSIYDIEII